MPDPNARRDKALESIARELGEVNKHLKRIADNGRSMKFTNYTEKRGEPDGSQQSSASGTEGASSHITGPPGPYDAPQNEGPYGAGTSQPYG